LRGRRENGGETGSTVTTKLYAGGKGEVKRVLCKITGLIIANSRSSLWTIVSSGKKRPEGACAQGDEDRDKKGRRFILMRVERVRPKS